MRLCSGPGCGRAVPDEVRFCDECKPSVSGGDGIRSHTYADRDRYGFLYQGRRWQAIRRSILQRDLFCTRCGREPSAIVDHRVPAGEAIRQVRESRRFPFDKHAGFYLKSNLQGLCRSCHTFKTDEDKCHTGEWPSVLEAEDRTPKKKWVF